MKKMVLILIFLIMLLPIKTKGASCDLSEFSSKKKLASNINWTYEYYMINDEMFFDVTFTNLIEDIYVIDTDTRIKYTNFENKVTKLPAGSKKTFEIYSNKCDEVLNNKLLTLPTYNKLSKYPECEGASEFYLCSKWGNVGNNVTKEELKIKVEEYKIKADVVPEEEVQKYTGEIKGFYFYVAFIIFALIMVNILLNKKDKEKDFI